MAWKKIRLRWGRQLKIAEIQVAKPESPLLIFKPDVRILKRLGCLQGGWIKILELLQADFRPVIAEADESQHSQHHCRPDCQPSRHLQPGQGEKPPPNSGKEAAAAGLRRTKGLANHRRGKAKRKPQHSEPFETKTGMDCAQEQVQEGYAQN